jgi:hypothetical protein
MSSRDAAAKAAGRPAAEASPVSGNSKEPQSPGTAGNEQGPAGEGRPPLLLLAALALAGEALALVAVSVLNVIDITSGQTFDASTGLGLVALQLVVAVGLAWMAFDVTRLRPWTRTPAVMVQILVLVVAVILLQAHQYPWGAPTLVLSLAGLAGLLNSRSLRALARPASTWEKPDSGPPKTTSNAVGAAKTGPVKKTSPARKTSTAAKSGNPKRSGNPAKRNTAAK